MAEELIEGALAEGRCAAFHRDYHQHTNDPRQQEAVNDKWAEQYDEILGELAGDGTSGCAYYTAAFFARHTPPAAVAERSKVLDIGCGTGAVARDLHSLGFAERKLDITGVDLSGGMLAVAKRTGLYSALVKHELPSIPFDAQTFDYALAAGCFSHGVVPKETINEMWRVTKHGGRLAYSIRKSVYDNEESGFQAIHEDMLGRDEVRLIAEESGTYLAKDNVEAVYFCWEVLHK